MCSLCGQPSCLFKEANESGQSGSGPQSNKPVFTNQEVIDQLDSGTFWSSGSGVAPTITYGVTTSNTWFPSNYSEYSGWSALNAKQASASHLAIELWDDLIASDIVQSGNPNSADIRFSNSSTGVSYAHAYYPGSAGTDYYSWQAAQGSIWFNPAYGSLTDPDVGEYGFMAIIHEIGHTLGLNHPGTYNGGSPTYANDALYEQDTHMYSVMSYFDAENTGADWYASNNWWYYAQTPMVHDILAIQEMYGADYTTRSGDTVYGFNSTTGSSIFDFTQNLRPVLTIWDGDGNDTLDLSGWNTNSTISLVQGSFSHANSMTHNIAIAYGADIENASGGGGNDQITGNDLANVLRGNGGNDVLNGGNGDDWLDGGAGFDTLLGGDGSDTLIFDLSDNLVALDGGAGDDLLIVNDASVPLAFDLSDHNLERARHVINDSGSNEWSQITDHYVDGWLRTAQDGTYDSGGRWHTDWDAFNSYSWNSVTDYFNSSNARYQQDGTNDDGRTWQTLWDVSGSEIWARQTTYQDLGDTINWDTLSLRFDDLNRLYDRFEQFDDGNTRSIHWDVDDTQAWTRRTVSQDLIDSHSWSEITQHFDDLDRLYEQFGITDDGQQWHTQWDVEDGQPWNHQMSFQDLSDTAIWSSLTLNYDDLNRFLDRFEVRDSGETYLIEWDLAELEAWSRQVTAQDLTDNYVWTGYTLRFTDANQIYEQTGSYDDGRLWNTQWDVNSTELWAYQTTMTDGGGNQFWTEVTSRYDDLGRLYERNGTYDNGRDWETLWDVNDEETWHRQARIIDTLDEYSWAELIYQYDSGGNLTNYTVVDDPIA